MSTFFTATQDAKKNGFTHLVSASGKFQAINIVTKNMKASPDTKKNGWAMASLSGVGQCLIYHDKPGHVSGYYRLANITNGYTTLFNSLCDTFQVSHPEIGACIAEFKELPEAVEYAVRG